MVKIIISTNDLHGFEGSAFMDILRGAGCTSKVNRTANGKVHLAITVPVKTQAVSDGKA